MVKDVADSNRPNCAQGGLHCKRKRALAGLAVFTALALGMAGCGTKATGPASGGSAGGNTGGTVKIGWIGGLTGPLSEFVLDSKEGADFAKDEINQKGGVLGKKIELIYADTQMDPQKAREAVQRYISSDKVAAIDGDYYSPNTLAIIPLTEQSKMPIATPNSNADEVTSQGAKYIVRVAASSSYNASVPVEYGLSKLKLKTWVVFGGSDGYSKSNVNAAVSFLKSHNGTLLGTESYDRATTKDFSNLLLKYKDNQPDAIFLAGGPSDTALIVKQARGLGIKSKFLSTNSAAKDAVWAIGGEALQDTVMVADFAGIATNYKDFAEQSTNDFIDAFKASHGGKIPSYDNAHGYDTLRIISQAIQAANSTDGAKVAEAMHKLQYRGALGTLKVQPNGAVVITMYIMKWNHGKMEIIGTATAQ